MPRCFLVLIVALTAGYAGHVNAQTPGDEDPAYKARASQEESWSQLVMLPDGKVLAVGGNYSTLNGRFVAYRLGHNGQPDPAFGTGGMATVDVRLNSPRITADSILVDPTGRIYLIGGNLDLRSEPALTSYVVRFAIARLFPDGAVDSGFGNGGVISHVLATDSDDPPTQDPLRTGVIHDVALLPDGKLLLIGQSVWENHNIIGRSMLFMLRLHTDGRLDTSFGTDGIALTEFNTRVHVSQMAVTNDGAILLLGSIPRHAVLKFTAQGALDSSFGAGGSRIVGTDPAYSYQLFDMALQPDGMILVSGSRTLGDANRPNSYPSDTMVARLTANGTPDPGFGMGGYSFPAVTPKSEYGGHVAVEPGGKILVAGTIDTLVGTATVHSPFLVRLSASGQLDSEFVHTDIEGYNDGFRDLVVGQGAYLLGTEDGPSNDIAGVPPSISKIRRYFIDPAPRSGSLSTDQSTTVSGFRIEVRNTSQTSVDSASAAQVLAINGYIYPQSADENATADVFVVAETAQGLFMRDSAGNFLPWNNQVTDLVPAGEDLRLTETTHVPIYAGTLPFAGAYALYIGYRRSNGGPLIYSDEPVTLDITP